MNIHSSWFWNLLKNTNRKIDFSSFCLVIFFCSFFYLYIKTKFIINYRLIVKIFQWLLLVHQKVRIHQNEVNENSYQIYVFENYLSAHICSSDFKTEAVTLYEFSFSSMVHMVVQSVIKRKDSNQSDFNCIRRQEVLRMRMPIRSSGWLLAPSFKIDKRHQKVKRDNRSCRLF